MKIITLIASILVASSAVAQQRGTPEEFAKKRVETVKKELSLTGQQEKELAALFLETIHKRDEIFASRRGNNETREQTQERLKKVKDEEKAKIQKILSPDQFKAYTAFLEKQRKEAERRGKEQGR
ncbi:MAG: hypothetical protein LBP56_04395 [Odoribacteraceae bacterium]|jgi:hypothetical protein|nr:hypothetical protein [Odoribacteraceae bacterium]